MTPSKPGTPVLSAGRWLACGLLLLGVAGVWTCRGSGPVHVSISLAALHKHAALSATSLDRIELRIFSDSRDTTTVDIPLREPEFEIEVAAGGAVHFEIRGLRTDLDEEVATYWGEQVVDLVPRTDIEMVIPIYPAGEVEGTVTIVGDATPPDGFAIVFTPDEARDELPPVFGATVLEMKIRRPLPVDTYTVDASFEAGDQQYLLVTENLQVDVFQGEVTGGLALVLAAGQSGREAARAMLAARDIRGARDAYVAAAGSSPTDLQAQAGAAFTRLLLFPEHASVTALLEGCGEPGLDVQDLGFGQDGFFTWLAKHRQGSSTVEIHSGASADSLNAVPFAPGYVFAELWSGDSDKAPAGGSDSSSPAKNVQALAASDRLEVRLEDLRGGSDGSGVVLRMEMPAASATYDLATLADAADGPEVWVDLSVGDSNSHPVSGTIAVTTAGAAGSEITIQLTTVVFESSLDKESGGSGPTRQEGTEIYVVSGTVSDTIYAEFEIDESKIPLSSMDTSTDSRGYRVESEFAILDACTGVTVATLLGHLDDLVAEFSAIRGHLDAIGTSNDFIWTIPVGAFANQTEVPMGPVMVNFLRGLLLFFEGSNDIMQQYNYFTTALDALVTTHDQWYEKSMTCDQYGDNCTTNYTPTKVKELDYANWVGDLNTNFLTHSTDLAMSNASELFKSSLNAFRAAMTAVPTEAVLLNFQQTAAQEGAKVVTDFIDLLLKSFDSAQTFAATPEYKVDVGRYIKSPIDRASILAAIQANGVTEMFHLTLAVHTAGSEQNPDLSMDDMVDIEVQKAIMDFPYSLSDIYCENDVTDTCPTAVEGNVQGGGVWACADHLDDGACDGDPNVACSPDDAGTCSGFCYTMACEPRDLDPFDTTAIDAWFDAFPFAFLNEKAWDGMDVYLPIGGGSASDTRETVDPPPLGCADACDDTNPCTSDWCDGDVCYADPVPEGEQGDCPPEYVCVTDSGCTSACSVEQPSGWCPDGYMCVEFDGCVRR